MCTQQLIYTYHTHEQIDRYMHHTARAHKCCIYSSMLLFVVICCNKELRSPLYSPTLIPLYRIAKMIQNPPPSQRIRQTLLPQRAAGVTSELLACVLLRNNCHELMMMLTIEGGRKSTSLCLEEEPRSRVHNDTRAHHYVHLSGKRLLPMFQYRYIITLRNTLSYISFSLCL